MPSQIVELVDVEQTVTRPVVMAIMEQIFEITSLSKDTSVFYSRLNGPHQTPGSNIDNVGEKEARFQQDKATYIEVTETDDVNSLQEMITMEYDQVPVFEDKALMCSLRPIYSTVDVSIAIRYRSTSETEVLRWMAAMKTKTSRGRDLNLHSVEYTYAIPYEFLEILKEIHQLRESTEPYGESFEGYLSSHGTDRFTILSNRAGEKGIVAVSEKQSRIQGLFDFAGLPSRPTHEQGTGMWEIAFTYKFSFQKPESMFIDYPTMVHNQLLPERYLSYIHDQEDPLYRLPYNNRTYRALQMFEADTQSLKIRREEPFIRIPNFDDFRPEEVIPSTATVFQALCSLEDDKQTLLDLKDLGDFMLDTDILEHLYKETAYMTRVMKSMFHISLYRNGKLAPDGILEVTDDLVVRSVKPLNLRQFHHVRFALYVDIGTVMKEAIDRLIGSPKAFIKVLAAINESFRNGPEYPGLQSRSEIQPYEVSELYYYLTGSHYGNQYAPSAPSAPLGWYGAPMWPDVEGQSFLDCVDVNMIRNHYRTKDPVYYRTVTNNMPPNERTDEILIDRFYKDKRRRRPEKNCSNVPYVTTIDRARMERFLGEKRRMHVTVMTTGVVAHRKTASQSHLKPV